MLRGMMNDRVRLVKADGKEFGEVPANVQRNMIFIDDANLPIEEGDRLIRCLPNGLDECYLVLDRGLYSAVEGMQAHYQVQVRKATAGLDSPKETAENSTACQGEGLTGHLS